MSAKSREIGTAALGGLVVGGVISTVLGVMDFPFASSVGAFTGGVVAAYLLYGKVGQAAMAGGLSGVLGYPLSLGTVLILFFLQLYNPPPSPTPPPPSVLQAAVALEFLLSFVSGGVGGLLGGAIRHPRPGAPGMLPPPPPGYVPGQVRYCVQCGAQMPGGTLICPHCNARQP